MVHPARWCWHVNLYLCPERLVLGKERRREISKGLGKGWKEQVNLKQKNVSLTPHHAFLKILNPSSCSALWKSVIFPGLISPFSSKYSSQISHISRSCSCTVIGSYTRVVSSNWSKGHLQYKQPFLERQCSACWGWSPVITASKILKFTVRPSTHNWTHSSDNACKLSTRGLRHAWNNSALRWAKSSPLYELRSSLGKIVQSLHARSRYC